MEVSSIRKLQKHDQYLEHLCDQLKEQYDMLITNVPLYSPKKRLVGEVDLIAVRDDGNYDIFEVKCSYRISKAKRQLRKIKKHLSFHSSVKNMFFFCGESQSLEAVI